MTTCGLHYLQFITTAHKYSSTLLEFLLCQKHNRGAGAAGVFLYIPAKQTHIVEIKKPADAKRDLISGCVQLERFSGQQQGTVKSVPLLKGWMSVCRLQFFT